MIQDECPKGHEKDDVEYVDMVYRQYVFCYVCQKSYSPDDYLGDDKND